MTENILSIGIDIGGTKISAAVVRNEQIISEVLTYKTPKSSQEILNTVLQAIEALTTGYNIQYAGIATAGTVNLENTRVTGSTGNLPEGYGNLDFVYEIQQRFGIKTFIENDANAAAYAEYKTGNARGDNNAIVITLGTGIGGGIIVNGKLLRGKSGVGAEVGHIPLTWQRKRKCTCGWWDCWEAYASGTGYAKNAQEMAKEILPENRTGILKDKNPDNLTTYDVIHGLNTGDPFSIKVHELWEEYLLMGLVSLVNIFDPESIILSGGMAKFVNFDKIKEELNKRTVISKVKLLPAKSENYAGIIGSAILALEKLK